MLNNRTVGQRRTERAIGVGDGSDQDGGLLVRDRFLGHGPHHARRTAEGLDLERMAVLPSGPYQRQETRTKDVRAAVLPAWMVRLDRPREVGLVLFLHLAGLPSYRRLLVYRGLVRRVQSSCDRLCRRQYSPSVRFIDSRRRVSRDDVLLLRFPSFRRPGRLDSRGGPTARGSVTVRMIGSLQI